MKRPKYAIAFLVFVFMAMIACLMGNTFLAVASLVFTSIFWSFLAMTLYISEKKVKSTLLGVDLKDYVRPALHILGPYAFILWVAWVNILTQKIEVFAIGYFMVPLFAYAFIGIGVGVFLLIASLTIKISKTDIKLDKPTADRIFNEIKELIAQE